MIYDKHSLLTLKTVSDYYEEQMLKQSYSRLNSDSVTYGVWHLIDISETSN